MILRQSFLAIAVVFIAASAHAQPGKNETANNDIPSPFAAGTFRLSQQSDITFQQFKTKGSSVGKDNDLEISPGFTWFPVNGLGIGLDARYGKSLYTTPGTTSDYQSWSAYFHLMYGYAFNDRYNAYIKIGYGPSKSDSKTTLGTNKTTLKSSFNDLAVSVGGPVRIEKTGRLFATPAISYDQYKGEAGNHDIKDKTMSLMIRMESYLPLTGNDKKRSMNYYSKGNNFIDYNTRFDIVSTTRSENQGAIQFADRKYNTTFFHAGYGLYFMDNIAGSLNLEFSKRVDKNPGSSNDKRSYFAIEPAVIVHAPAQGPLNHLFAKLSCFLSSGKQSGSVKTKETNFDLRAGYNLFIARNLALTPQFGYSMEKYTAKYTTSNNILKSNGIAGEVILKAWLDWKWLK